MKCPVSRITGAPGAIRTPDPLVRSQVLYPAELRARCAFEAADYTEPNRLPQVVLLIFLVFSGSAFPSWVCSVVSALL